jgi:hypothetical protein
VSTEAMDVAGDLRRLLDEGVISRGSLTAITGITAEAVDRFLGGPGVGGPSAFPSPFTADESARLSQLVAQLAVGLTIEDDVRLRAIIETLTQRFHLPPESIALLTHVELGALDAFLRDPRSVDPETRYALASRASYLLTACANAAAPPGPC